MSFDPGADSGWRKRKPGNVVPPFKPRRAPSHLNTQVRDPGFMKIDVLVGKMLEGMDSDNVEERTDEFITRMRQYLHRVGAELLTRMFATKKLTELVLERLCYARRGAVACGCHSSLQKLDDLLSVFPTTSSPSEEQSTVYARMNSLMEEENKTYKIIQDGHRLEMQRKGITRVEWSDDDDF